MAHNSLKPIFQNVEEKLRNNFDISDEHFETVQRDLAYLINKELSSDPKTARAIVEKFMNRVTAERTPQDQQKEFAQTMMSIREKYGNDTDRLRERVADKIQAIAEKHPDLVPVFNKSEFFQDELIASLLFEQARLGK